MAIKCFDVVESRGDRTIFVVFQSDFLAHLDTRLVIPLYAVRDGDKRETLRLNPRLTVADQDFFLGTHLSLTVQLAALRSTGQSLEHERDRIRDAFDFLTTGF